MVNRFELKNAKTDWELLEKLRLLGEPELITYYLDILPIQDILERHHRGDPYSRNGFKAFLSELNKVALEFGWDIGALSCIKYAITNCELKTSSHVLQTADATLGYGFGLDNAEDLYNEVMLACMEPQTKLIMENKLKDWLRKEAKNDCHIEALLAFAYLIDPEIISEVVFLRISCTSTT